MVASVVARAMAGPGTNVGEGRTTAPPARRSLSASEMARVWRVCDQLLPGRLVNIPQNAMGIQVSPKRNACG